LYSKLSHHMVCTLLVIFKNCDLYSVLSVSFCSHNWIMVAMATLTLKLEKIITSHSVASIKHVWHSRISIYEWQNVMVEQILLPCKAQPASARLPVLQVGGHSSLRNGWDTHTQQAHVHTQALAWQGEICRWMSAAAGASGDWVLASILFHFVCSVPSGRNAQITAHTNQQGTSKAGTWLATAVYHCVLDS